MRFERGFRFRAIPALTAGIALLFLIEGCQPKRPPEEPAPAVPEAEAVFEQAQQYDRLGAFDRAFDAYEAFVREQPHGEKTRQALYRMARIRYGDRLFAEALSLLERIAREYPEHPDAPRIELEILSTLYHMGNHASCRTRGNAWLRTHSGHPLEGEVRFLLGRNEQEAGEPVEAFSQWMRAADLFAEDADALKRLDQAVTDLIQSASLDQLQEMSDIPTAHPYLPLILLRTAHLHVDREELAEAQEAAFALLDATSDPDRVIEARRILARIDEKLSVTKGRIGCLLPMSGPFRIYGEETLNGIQMAAAPWLDESSGPEIELLIRDTRGDADVTAAAVEELARESRVMAIIGPLSSKAAQAAAAKAQELGVPIITMTQKEDLPRIGDMVYRNFLTPSMQVEALLDRAVHILGLHRFGILYPDNPYGHHFMNLFWDGLEALGCEVTAVESYAPDKTDFADEVQRMLGLYYPRPASVVRMLEERKAAMGMGEEEEKADTEDEPEPILDFDAVFIPDNSERVALIAPQFPFHKVLNIRFLGTSLWQSQALIELAGDYVQGAILPSGFFSELDTEPVQSFVMGYEASFGQAPGLLAAVGYDTMRFLRETLSDPLILTRNDIRRAIYEFDGLEGATGRIRFDRYGELEKPPRILTVKGNRFVPFDDSQAASGATVQFTDGPLR
ncbi:MAG: penicillin-binding protein activator [Desulfobacteraceae bacterium]|jgi:ABC-type branched-subunit amino acid transport system substrate-binding protein